MLAAKLRIKRHHNLLLSVGSLKDRCVQLSDLGRVEFHPHEIGESNRTARPIELGPF